MKNGNRLSLLFKDLSTASLSFEQSLQIDFTKFPEFEADVIKNGQIQKLNIQLNCYGKPLKNYFEVKRETIFLYPKDVIKAFFAEEAIDEETYLILMDAVESRNLLSHVYKIEMFDLIYPKLKNYAAAIKHTCNSIEPHAI